MMKILVTIFCLIASTSLLYSVENGLINKVDNNLIYTIYPDNYGLALTGGNKIATYNEGDQKVFWKNDLSIMPPGWIQENAECVAVTDNAYIFVALDQVDLNFFEKDIDTVKKYLEEATYYSNSSGVLETLFNNFGEYPIAINNDPKVVIYFTELKSYMGSVIPGYFYSFDQIPEDVATQYGYHSNECNIVYMSCFPLKPTEKYNISILARELQQMIHFGKDWDEQAWVTEGLSQYAMLTCGIPTQSIDFHTNSNISLFDWGSKRNADSVRLMLFFDYLAEHYGASELTLKIVADTLNGMEGIVSGLKAAGNNVDIKDVVTDWTIANFIDDGDFESGRYGYELVDLPAFRVEETFNEYPIESTSSVYNCAAVYYDLPTGFIKLDLSFDFPNGGDWSTSLIAFDGAETKEVIKSTNSKLNYNQPDGYSLSRLVLVVTNTSTDTLTTENFFSFTANNITNIEENSSVANGLSIYPNPAGKEITINYSVKEPGVVNLILFDVLGNKIQNLFNEYKEAGTYNLIHNLSGIPAGTYTLRFEEGDYSCSEKFVVVK